MVKRTRGRGESLFMSIIIFFDGSSVITDWHTPCCLGGESSKSKRHAYYIPGYRCLLLEDILGWPNTPKFHSFFSLVWWMHRLEFDVYLNLNIYALSIILNTLYSYSNIYIYIYISQNIKLWTHGVFKFYIVWEKGLINCISVEHFFFQTFLVYIYLIIIYINIYHHHHHHVVPLARISLTLSRHSSPLAGLQDYTPYPHIAAGCMFELVVRLLSGHMWGSSGVHHLWASPAVTCMSGSSSLDSFRDGEQVAV